MRQDRIAPEIPSPVDFADLEQARAWVRLTVETRPWRPRFFAAFAMALNQSFARPVRIAELGSGPGHLAAALLLVCRNVSSYTALDFSPAMHALAREHLGPLASRVHFVQQDFRSDEWAGTLGPFDAILTMQAAHEVRHRTRLPSFLRNAHRAISDGGLLLFCDHYAEAGSRKNPELFPTREEQPCLLTEAGFSEVTCLLDEGGMALYRAGRP